MSISRSRNNICTEATALVMNKLADAYEYCYNKVYSPTKNNEDEKEVPRYKSLTRKECFYSRDSEDSNAFSREVFKATELAKKSSKHKCRMSLGSSENHYNAIVFYHPQDIQDLYKNHIDKLNTKESVNIFGHHFNKKRMPVIMALSSDDKRYPDVRNQFSGTVLGKQALKKMFPTLQKIATELHEKYKNEERINISDFGSHFALRTILQGIIKAPEVKDETIQTLSHAIDTGVDKAAAIGSASRIALEAYVPWKLQSDADPLLVEVEKIIHDDVLVKNEKAISKNSDSWLMNTINRENEQIVQENKGKGCLTKTIEKFTSSKPGVTSGDSVKETAFVITAGSDTTAHNIANAFISILMDEKIQDELIKEIFSLEKSPEAMTMDDIASLTLTKKVVLEVLRLKPPLPLQKVLVAKDFTTHDGVEIKAGTHIYINVRECNRTSVDFTLEEKESKDSKDAKFANYYKDLDKFNPHRFDGFDEKTLNRFTEQPGDFKLQYSFYTFGRSRRMCPGRELAVLETTVALVNHFYHFNMKLLNSIIEDKITFGMRPVSYDSENSKKEIPIEASISLKKK